MGARRHRLARARSFTLIELLVVTVIIAVLAGLLFAALRNARESARRATCASHARQIALALLVYAEDCSGWMNGVGGPSAASNTWLWYEGVVGYLGNNRELVRPDRNVGCPGVNLQDSHTGPFGANTAMVGRGYDPTHAVSEVVNGTARIFLVADCYYALPSSGAHFDFTSDGNDGSGIYTHPRHRGKGLNFVFLDGHGEFLRGGTNQTAQWWNWQSAEYWWPYHLWTGYGGIWGE